MRPGITVSRAVFYPVIFVFGAACWYIGYSQGLNPVPLGVEIIELPVCLPDPAPLPSPV